MVRSSWPDRKVSVILLPSGEQGEALLALAGEWTRMGLLGPALWVRPERVQRARSGPPRIGATILLLDREHRLTAVDVDLFESLARESLALVRLVKLRSAVPSREVDAEQDDIAEQVGEYLVKAMPMAVPSVSIADQPTDLSRLTLICAPTEFQLQQRVDWAASEYGTVVVASPEDRSTPWSGDAFVRDNDRFVGFALMHLASVAGLWNGAGVGSFELVQREASSHQSVWVSRVFVNAVITEALGRRTAAQVLDLASRADSLLIDPSAGSPPTGTAFIDDSLVPGYVDQMVAASMSLDQGALSFHPIEEERQPDRARIGIVEQLRRFGSFSADKLVSMPRWTWRWITSRTGRALTRQLQSDDGTHIVGQDFDSVLDARDARLIARRDEIFDAEKAARAAMSAPVGVGGIRTTPRLWARLRELVFGSLDGSSDLTDLGFVKIEEKVPVFGRVSDVFPDPDAAWTIEDGPANLPVPVDWYVLAAGEPRTHLAAWASAGLGEAQQAANEMAAAEHAFRLLPEPVAAPEQPMSSGGVATSPAGPAAESAASAPPAQAARAAEAADGDIEDKPESEAPASEDPASEEPDAAAPTSRRALAAAAAARSGEVGEPVVDPAEATEADRATDPTTADDTAAHTHTATDSDAPSDRTPGPDVVFAAPSSEQDASSDRPSSPDAPAPAAPAPPAPAPAPPAPVIPSAPETPEQAANREHREQMQREMRVQWEDAKARRDAAAARAQAAEAERRRRDEALASYDDWAVGRDRSFTWRLLAALNADRTAAQTAVARYAREIDRLRAPMPGELLRLRKAFHQRMLVAWLVIIGVVALVELLPILLPELRDTVRRVGFWYPETWVTITVGLVIGLLLTLGFLAAYHRGWSTFQRHVDLTHAHLEHISDASRHARRELARLSSLHRQMVDWLDLLARAVHHPWAIRPEWESKPDYELARESLPFAMNIGTVVETDYAAATRLRRMTTEHLLRRGWRADAFRDLVREVGAELGQDGAAFGVGALDDDLPHSSNNARRMLRDAMSQESVLTRVAAPRLRELMGEIQRHSLHGSKPRVTAIEENPLDAVARMTDPIGIDAGIAWDDFLLDSLAGRREPVTPLSATWLAQRQVQEGHHENVTSYLVMPERLERQLGFHEDARVVTAPFRGSGRAGIDLVWRVDVAGPLPIGAIGLWDAPQRTVAVEIDPDTYDSGI
ncbi:brain acid soluble protein 1 [Microbacterium sp. M28]|uniref:brain acid soluble protein 1 n=1 Tax=Microbacterium sp. M28 TaxID=2962064 RepID=UPI0021F44694|nr:brain acid soluble protein 1 [Microbacterium sp. M28]UYO96210.1 brain acid soluble protein 1 [Microbacterium sp. M28]